MKEEKLGQEPAFPLPADVGVNYYFNKVIPDPANGMSKRFYAACAAMQGMLAHSTRYHCRPEDSHLTWKQGMIKEAYELADELLRQEEL